MEKKWLFDSCSQAENANVLGVNIVPGLVELRWCKSLLKLVFYLQILGVYIKLHVQMFLLFSIIFDSKLSSFKNASQKWGKNLASNVTVSALESCLPIISWLMLESWIGHNQLCLHLFARPNYRFLPSGLCFLTFHILPCVLELLLTFIDGLPFIFLCISGSS